MGSLNRRVRLAVLLVSLLFGGCLGGGPPPQDHFYRLGGDGERTGRTGPALKGVVAVERFLAAGLLSRRELMFSEAGNPLELKAYHYHLWVEPPPTLFQERMVAFLRNAGIAGQVVRSGEHPAPDHVVGGSIRRLERRLGSPSVAVVELELTLGRAAGGTPQLIHTYRSEQPLADETMGGAVAGLDAGVTEILNRFLADCLAPQINWKRKW